MTRAVTDILYRTDGTAWASAPVTFERKAGSFDDGSSWPPDEKQVTTDETGAYSVQLWPDASGSLHSHYRVSYPNGDTFYVSIPDGTTPISMPEIRIAPLVQPVPPSALDAHVAASDPHAGYLLPAEADLLYAALVHSQPWSTITATPTTIAGYGITDAFTQAQADARYAPIVHTQAWATISGTPTTLGGYGIGDAYTKGEVDIALGGKANAATTLAGYGITDAYTKAAADARYAPVSHNQAWSTITGTPTTVAGYGITDAYTKTAADARYAAIVHNQAWSTITGTPTTVAGYGITDVYTQTQANANLALKANLAGGNSFTGAQLVTSDATGTKPLIVKGFLGQTATLQEWQDSTGAVLASVSATGSLTLNTGIGPPSNNAVNIFHRENQPLGVAVRSNNTTTITSGGHTTLSVSDVFGPTSGTAGHTFLLLSGTINQTGGASGVSRGISISPTLTAAADFRGIEIAAGGTYAIYTLGGKVQHETGTAATIGLIVKGAASQSADLQQWLDSAGAVLSRIDKNGYFMTRKNAAPADADLPTSGLAIWFDSTTGAAKVMFKGKNAAGTVVAGQVALT